MGWMDKYQDGGIIYVDSADDPRYKAYQDSLAVWKGTEGTIKRLQNTNSFAEWDKFADEIQFSELGKKGAEAFKRLKELNGEYPTPKASMEKAFSDGIGDTEEYYPPKQKVIIKNIPKRINPKVQSVGNLQPKNYTPINIENYPDDVYSYKPKYWDITQTTPSYSSSRRVNSEDELQYYKNKQFGDAASYTGNRNTLSINPVFNMDEKVKLQKGGIIQDNRGQWAHPGKVTEINSNNITMQGVNYPVLGISDTGDTKMMMPGENYKFQGNKVTEYPIKAQDGKTLNLKNLQQYKSPNSEEMEQIESFLYDLEYNTPLRDREDFKGNLLSKIGTYRSNLYGQLGDLYNYYSSIPLEHKALYKSKYKPTNSKDPDAEYISIRDDHFINQVLYHANRLFVDGDESRLNMSDENLSGRDRKINNNTYSVSAYNKNNTKENKYNEKTEERAIGRYFVSKGKDDEGEYISYYDQFDSGQPSDGLTSTETWTGIAKPFEIYDRIYVEKDSTGKYIPKKKMKNGGWLDKYNK